MKLLQFTDLYISSLSLSLSKSTKDKNSRLRSVLASYLGGDDTDPKDIDLRAAQSRDFIAALSGYLIESHPAHYSQTTVTEILGDLRKIIRAAIARDLVPAYDPLDPASAGGRVDAGYVSPVTPASKLVAGYVAMRPFAARPDSPEEYRRRREDDLNLRCLALYLFGMSCYGLEISDIIRLRKADVTAEGIYVARYGRLLPFPPQARRLVYAYNYDSGNPGEYVFHILHGSETEEMVAKKAEGIRRRIRRVINKHGFSIFHTGSVMHDWISESVAGGLQGDIAEALVAASLTGAYEALSADALVRAQMAVDSFPTPFREDWYMLRVYNSRLNASKMKEQILALGVLGTEAEGRARVYDPVDGWTVKDGKPRGPLTRFLFFKGTAHACAQINSYHRDAAVLRNPATGGFAVIPEVELRQMQMALRDFRDDVELINRTEWLNANEDTLQVGGEVEILDGNLKGMTATIVEIHKGRDDVERTYLLSFVQGSITFRTSLKGVSLKPISRN